MTQDNEHTEEAEYEVVARRQGRVQLEISIPGEKQPIGHGMKVEDITSHPGTTQEAIEERVQRIAARHRDPGDDLDLPQSGKTEYDPRTRDGKPKEEILSGMSDEEKNANSGQ